MTNLETQAYSYFYSDKDSTYFYYDKMHQLAIEEKDNIKAIDNLNDLCVAAGVHYDLNKIESTIVIIDSLIQKNKKLLEELPDKGEAQKNYFLYNKGNYYYTLENYGRSQIYFDSIVNNIIQKPSYTSIPDDVAFVSICYSFIAQMNSLQGKFKVADEYYQKNIRLYKDHIPSDTDGLYKVYNLYAQSLYTQNKYSDSKKYWSTTYNYIEKNYTENNRNSIITTGLSLATLHKDIAQIDSAMYYFDALNKYRIKDDPLTDRFLTVKGEIQIAKHQLNKAMLSFEEALKASLPSDRPRMRKKIGDLHTQIGQPDQAIKSYQFALQELSTDFVSNDFSKNPEPSKIKQKQLLLSILGAKAKSLSFQKNHADKQSSIETVDLGIQTLDILKPTFKNHADKLILIEDAFPLFETGMETIYHTYLNNNNNALIDKAFKYSEKSKAVILLDALLGVRATKFANIPEELLDQENELKSRISYIEKNFKNSSNAKESNEVEDELFSLQQEYAILVNKIEKKYPDYYDLRFNTEVTSLSTIQQILSPSELLISYFYGNEAIYAIGVDKNSKQIHRIPLNVSLENAIKKTRQMLADSKSDVTALGNLSHKLYQKLISPLVTSKEKKKLIIISDGLLNYIPFGALNIKENELSYLIENRAISYSNSATLYAQLNERDKKNGELMAFAPLFLGEQIEVNPNRDKLLPLPHNTREVEQILNSFTGRSFVAKNASLQNFTSQLSNYSMLHLATHAVFDDTKPEYSYLAFSNTGTEDNLLYVNDLYNLQIDADLVTLSACESGVGELKRGEGFLSLARGFFYSGASSIASTLWKVNDASTANLMDSFYGNLSDGNTKDVALQMAKTNFLETNRQNGLSHPYYWSGFIISGNTEALTATNNIIWISGVGVLFALLARIFLSKKKST